jgi:mRNA-degrading endonuclease toxin of MazEF toxin-antitoxin module
LQVVVGGIYFVRDDFITLVPRGDRPVSYERRPVLVVSGPSTNSDAGWSFVLVCPISSSTSRRTKFCVKLASGDGNLPKKGWVRVPAVQPMEKSALQDHTGVIPEDKLAAVQARLVEYLGLLDEEDEPPSSPPLPDVPF